MSAGWYGIPADAFEDLRQRTVFRLQELGEWTHTRYRNLVDPRLACSDPRYQHLYRRKTTWDLIRLSAAVCGIEFCYAAETAFVSPTLLKIGIPVLYMTLIWCLSPAIGFFLVPFLGSCSDRCGSWMGRRRPFILLLSIGIVFGLALVPHGSSLGYFLGDSLPEHINETIFLTNSTFFELDGDDEAFLAGGIRPIGIILTIVGVMALDLCADSCQSPARAYLLDVCLPEDHARGLSTFTAMAGLGGGLGYMLGAVHWEQTSWGAALGGQEASVFFIVLLIYLVCLTITITSFREMPRQMIEQLKAPTKSLAAESIFEPYDEGTATGNYDRLHHHRASLGNGNSIENELYSDLAPLHGTTDGEDLPVTLQDYLWSIVYMPASLRVLCLTNLCCWMSLVCYSLYFTDFVGQSVFGGDPTATRQSDGEARRLYEEGVRFGCWGMSIYSVSCSVYSSVIERLIFRLGAKKVYVGGQLIYSIGMFLMAITRNKFCVILFSATAGIMYSTLFTMPFFLVAHYHSSGLFDEEQPVSARAVMNKKHIRGLGTDVATVSSMVFLAQFILSSLNGTLVHITGSPTSTVVLSAVLSCCGAFAATKVTYVNL
ncbi:Membrane-associated transporter protein [Hypsibius exemplaris]|uniref:Membrane-associated transporter protein n=1 Tax=Hypsibius exemplaris TaxID=2072580 RepID=A0A1W0WF15_HYPEX|nr:Membrane-associated transporter protein [Hypsibius exemplaris]